MNNIKDKLTTICGLLFAVCGAIIGVQTQVALPKWLITSAVVVGAICAAVTMWATGKRPDLGTKSPSQVEQQNGNK